MLAQALGESLLVRCAALARLQGDFAEKRNVLHLLHAYPSRVTGSQVRVGLGAGANGCGLAWVWV